MECKKSLGGLKGDLLEATIQGKREQTKCRKIRGISLLSVVGERDAKVPMDQVVVSTGKRLYDE